MFKKKNRTSSEINAITTMWVIQLYCTEYIIAINKNFPVLS